MDQIAEWIAHGLMLATAAAVTLWMVGAIYYEVCGGTRWGRWLAVAWVAAVVALFIAWQPLWQPFAVLLGVLAHFLV